MSILLQNVKVVDRLSPYNGKTVSIFIQKDQITAIGKTLEVNAAKVIDCNEQSVSPGWLAMNCNFNDPGFETSETLESGSKAAQLGGFTSVAITPNTSPVIDSKAGIEYIARNSQDLSTQMYALGALTKGLQGTEISELYDMYAVGAIGFSNAKSNIKNPNVLKLALQYTQTFGSPVLIYPNHPDLSDHGQMNEGKTSTFLGLKGIPSIAEEMIIARDLAIAEYCESAIHFTGISTAKSVTLIEEAKNKGIQVTASVNLYNLVLTDVVLKSYDTHYKVSPPLRTEIDQQALIKGLKKNVIDAISIDHIPLDIEQKKCEFDLAEFGMRSLETTIGILGKHLQHILTWEEIVTKISNGPRQILDVPKIVIKEGSIAELTLFNEKKEWNYNKATFPLKSYNNPFLENSLRGFCTGTINKGKHWLNPNF